MKYATLIALLALTGCNSVTPIGKAGEAEYLVVRSTDLFGPSIAHIVRIDPDGTTTDLPTASSAGLAPALIGAGGDIAAQAVRRPDETTVDIGDRQYLRPSRP